MKPIEMEMMDWQCEDMARQAVMQSPKVQDMIAAKKAQLKKAMATALQQEE
jgi:hypothetical protein